MEVTIWLEWQLLKDMLMLERVEEGKEWNYTRIEPSVNALRYKIIDRVLTLVMLEVDKQMGKKPVLHTYDRK